MKKFAGIIAGSILAGDISGAALAEELIAAKNIRAGAIISASDIASPKDTAAMRRAVDMIGKEAIRTFYQGQPLTEDNLRTPTLVKRNAIIHMEYSKGPMIIHAEGRALDKGGIGERIRVMNLISKRVVTATIIGADSVRASS